MTETKTINRLFILFFVFIFVGWYCSPEPVDYGAKNDAEFNKYKTDSVIYDTIN